jgi:hypothetical protein
VRLIPPPFRTGMSTGGGRFRQIREVMDASGAKVGLSGGRVGDPTYDGPDVRVYGAKVWQDATLRLRALGGEPVVVQPRQGMVERPWAIDLLPPGMRGRATS